MSVPAALTAILSLGPAYGLQLHAELGARLKHRASTNVGQIYSTLDRLVRDGLVDRAGETHDGLPMYALTEAGIVSVTQWLSGTWLSPTSAWPDILDVLLLSSTLPKHSPEKLCAQAETVFSLDSDGHSLGDRAQSHFSRAVLAVIQDVRAAHSRGELPATGLSKQRPTRGRRPATPTKSV